MTEKSWTELPNVLGDQKKVEELCDSGATDLAAMGTIAHAMNEMRKSEMTPAEPRFLYPTSRQFPFDQVTFDIIKELEKRKFNVPGVTVKFDKYGPSNAYNMIREIRGNDFRLYFCRVQGRIDSTWNDTAAVTTLNIPRKELHVYDDNSGPTLYVYVRKDLTRWDCWENNKEKFMNSAKVNSKLDLKPKTYLQYKGSWQTTDGGVHYPGKVAPFLAHTNDLGRQYDPWRDEPTYFRTQDVFREFQKYFEGKLEEIVKHGVVKRVPEILRR